MNEFIVWNNEIKKFIGLSGKLNDGCTVRNDGMINMNTEDCTIHQYIGKTDINNKKIYADCSIVEFEYTESELFNWQRKTKTFRLKGFFRYSIKRLGYMVYVLDKDVGQIEYCQYDESIIHLVKIIDTIQENKLGLIK